MKTKTMCVTRKKIPQLLAHRYISHGSRPTGAAPAAAAAQSPAPFPAATLAPAISSQLELTSQTVKILSIAV